MQQLDLPFAAKKETCKELGVYRQDLHREMIKNLLLQIKEREEKTAFTWPLVIELPLDPDSLQICFCSLALAHQEAFKFFSEMICSSLIPYRVLNVDTAFAAEFAFTEEEKEIFCFGEEGKTYSIFELVVSAESLQERQLIRAAFAERRKEICLGLESSHFARRIMEVQGLSLDEKSYAMRKHISYLIHRRPALFGHELLSEMQLLLFNCTEEFKMYRGKSALVAPGLPALSFPYIIEQRDRTIPSEKAFELKDI